MPTPHTNEGQTQHMTADMEAFYKFWKDAGIRCLTDDAYAIWKNACAHQAAQSAETTEKLNQIIGMQSTQLTANAETIARLEEEKAGFALDLMHSQENEQHWVQKTIALQEQLAAAQLKERQLREALEIISNGSAMPRKGAVKWTQGEVVIEYQKIAERAIAQPLDTSALDAYVAEKTATPKWEPLTHTGQIKEGCKVRFKLAGSEITATACAVLRPGTDVEEIIYNRKKNHYFITSMVLDGSSSHKDVEFLPPSPNTQGVE